MAQILSLIFKDKDLCNALAFKGGTSLMFFHNSIASRPTLTLIYLIRISSISYMIKYALF